MSRSIPLWRSDLPCYPGYSGAAIQNETHGLGLWAPLSAGICDREDTYMFRSAMGPGLDLGMPEFEKDTSKHFSIDWLRKMFGELNQVRDLFLGDFYPLHGVHAFGRRLGRLAIRSPRPRFGGRVCLSPRHAARSPAQS